MSEGERKIYCVCECEWEQEEKDRQQVKNSNTSVYFSFVGLNPHNWVEGVERDIVI